MGSKDLRGTNSGYKHPEEILANFHFHVSPWRTQTDAPNAMASPSLYKFTKARKSIRQDEQRRRTPNISKIHI
jgi:hypothetical protein